MKLKRKLIREIARVAKAQGWGKGRYVELGTRAIGVSHEWYNRLDPQDEDGDLMDFLPIADIIGMNIPEVEGRVLLDFFVHNSDELCTNVMVEMDTDGIGAIYDPSYSNDSRVWTRQGFIPHSEVHISKKDSRINYATN